MLRLFSNTAAILTNSAYIQRRFFSYSPDQFRKIYDYANTSDSLQDLIHWLQNPDLEREISLPKSVLLSGPIATDNAFWARTVIDASRISAITAQAITLCNNVSSIESTVSNLFQSRGENTRSIVYIQNMELPGFRKKSTTLPILLNSLFEQIIPQNSGMLLMVTTTDPGMLDRVSQYPYTSRFDRHIRIPLPTKEDRMSILKIATENKRLSNISLELLAEISINFTCTDLLSWVDQAVIRAHRTGSNVITLQHFDETKTYMQLGTLGKIPDNVKAKSDTAHHEAGHALIAIVLGIPFYKISIRSNPLSLGRVELIQHHARHVNPSEEETLNKICFALAGRAAELLCGNKQFGARSDFEIATRLANELVNEHFAINASLILQQQLERAKNLLQTHSGMYKKIIDLLLNSATGELTETELLKLLSQNDCVSRDSKVSTVSILRPKQTILKLHPFTTEELAKTLGVNSQNIIKTEIIGGSDFLIELKMIENDVAQQILQKLEDNNIQYNFTMKDKSCKFIIHQSCIPSFIQLIHQSKDLPTLK